jgi:hypothetical protein
VNLLPPNPVQDLEMLIFAERGTKTRRKTLEARERTNNKELNSQMTSENKTLYFHLQC